MLGFYVLKTFKEGVCVEGWGGSHQVTESKVRLGMVLTWGHSELMRYEVTTGHDTDSCSLL